MIPDGKAESPLAAQRSGRVRLFKRMETLVSYLKGVGILQFDVDAADYTPETASAHSRPDRAEALRRPHEAAAYDKWFRGQVDEASREADDPNTARVSNEDAEKQWSEMRAGLITRMATGAKA